MDPIPFGLLTLMFTLACWLALGMTALAALVRTEALHLFGTAAFIFVMFGVSMSISSTYGPPQSMAHYPFQDLALLFMLWRTWGRHAARWKWVVGLLLVAQLGFHAGYWTLFINGDDSRRLLRRYILLNNSAFGAILATLTLTGGSHVWRARSDLADLFRRCGEFLRGAVAAGPQVAR